MNLLIFSKRKLYILIILLLILSSCWTDNSITIDNYKSDNNYIKSDNKDNNYVNVKYRSTKVDINNNFVELDTSKSSFIKWAWYDESKEYMIIKLKNTNYHYCWIDRDTWNWFKNADSFGKYFNIYIKNKFDCRVWDVPNY